ncbi:hypothetical protein GM608_03030 [Bombella sp. ESL0380]|uniref:Uncharacterized protein n=2 Tax=Acetobacterales TaxID=3120395 RepID=A0ABR9MMC1_9PROT|nr:hypothetical protein [Bombella apis]MBE1723020.1 hypothetical protein [Bombella apis]MBR9730827.1 hypothetical protein [Bombella apis]MCT6814629.1 hypothetical protein [Bombella apis]MUG79202.1 hypothetical protein [Bombella sp. ESL0380]
MKHLDLILALLCLFFWVALYVVYYHERLFPWLINRFSRDRPSRDLKVENGYFSDGVPIPFRDNLYPSDPEKDARTEDGSTSPEEPPHETVTRKTDQTPNR